MDKSLTSPDYQPHHELRLDRILKAAAGVATIAALASGCSAESKQAQPEGRYAVAAAKINGGEVRSGVNVRFDPEVIEDEGFGDTNSCGTTPENFVIPESFGAVTTKSEANGSWVGINSHTAGLPEKCEDDNDGTVWINAKYYKGSIRENNPPVIQRIARN